MPASRPSRTELRRVPAPIRSRHWPIPPGAKAGKRRAIGTGPKQLVGPAQTPAPAPPYRRSPVTTMSIYRLQPSAIRCPAPAGLPLLVQFVGRYFAEATPLKSLGNGSARPGQTEGIHRWCDPIERGAQSPFQAGTEGSNLAPSTGESVANLPPWSRTIQGTVTATNRVGCRPVTPSKWQKQ